MSKKLEKHVATSSGVYGTFCLDIPACNATERVAGPGFLTRLNAFARIGSGILYEIRPAVLLGMLRQDVNFHDKHPPAELGSRLPRTIAENSIPQALLCVCSRKSIHQDFRGPC